MKPRWYDELYPKVEAIMLMGVIVYSMGAIMFYGLNAIVELLG